MFTCPCCGYEVFGESPGSYEICPFCFWEDDASQLYFPNQAGGPNPCSLMESQVNFVQFGACNREMVKNVRPATAEDTKDPLWFPLWEKRIALPDPKSDKVHPMHEKSIAKLCYWLRT
ncbi:CPCC family cysteine-rich protein [Chitinimonas viridis]|uniref:CPCC family cysteine-rich protein n=1 Tax=Chitinimonas viridis TaxID=664880 RepID=A0ABT8B1C8_9NEIS|nr:CPCC family cysteine-rich protein [Chitinimonas viridis]